MFVKTTSMPNIENQNISFDQLRRDDTSSGANIVQTGIASIQSEASSCCFKRRYVSLLYCISTKVIGLSREFHWITTFRTSQCWLCSDLCRRLLPTTQWGRQLVRRHYFSDCIWCGGDWTYRLIPTGYTDFRDFRRRILVSTRYSVLSNCCVTQHFFSRDLRWSTWKDEVLMNTEHHLPLWMSISFLENGKYVEDREKSMERSVLSDVPPEACVRPLILIRNKRASMYVKR